MRAALAACGLLAAAAAAPAGHVTFLPIRGRNGGRALRGGARISDSPSGAIVEWDILDADKRCQRPAAKAGGCAVKLHSGSCASPGAVVAELPYTTDRAMGAAGSRRVAGSAAQTVGRAAVVTDSDGEPLACGMTTAQPLIRRDYPSRNNTNVEPPRYNPRRAKMHREMAEAFHKCEEERRCPYPKSAHSSAKCVNGKSVVGGDEYDCKGIDLMSFVPAADLGYAVQGNDIWGWVDPQSGHEIAVHCLRNSASFVDVTDAENPVVLAWMPGTRSSSGSLQSASWRDAKVYKNHAFIGADSINNHGLQIFDLTRLRQYYNRKGAVVPEVQPDLVYQADGFGPSHNIVINEETGFLYSVGSRSYRGGPHIIDIGDPKNPKFIKGYDTDGYTHDAECVVYRGPDSRHHGKEICFCYNEDTLTILDVSDKDAIDMLARVPYRNNYYTHQGWLTADQSHLLLDDELDEQYTNEKHTRTMQWDVSDLSAPKLIGEHISTEMSIDHNLYIHNGKAYMSQYCSGLRVLDVANIAKASTPEVAFYDMAPYCDTQSPSGVAFSGTWSNYPFFPSGNIIVNSIELGLFVLRLQDSVANSTAH
eukprot:TRINITY_DN4812_c1_g1_i1.p1 TRINITY_DN4812_c1_g1~~TRINITY_DN4812_c1_g1_i1.p1  ORF type:complete len:618 (+),score=257.14 TRINITY_DN4812_c1_g1_i1:83-1855(+)